MKNSFDEIWTDDELVSKLLFQIVDKNKKHSAIKFLFRCLKKGNIEQLRFVARYLVGAVDNPIDAKRLLDKYIVAMVYCVLRYYEQSKKLTILDESLRSEYFDSIYENGLTIEILNTTPENDEGFNKLMHIDREKIAKELEPIFSKIEGNAKSSGIELDEKLISECKKKIEYRIDFFQKKTKFKYFKENVRRTDMLIAEAINSRINRSFSFELPDYEDNISSFISNLYCDKAKNNSQIIKDAKIVVAHLCNESIANEVPLDMVPTIKSTELKCYQLSDEGNLTKKIDDIDAPILKFLTYKNNSYYPKLERINEFRFIYNNKEYLFSSDGIIELWC